MRIARILAFLLLISAATQVAAEDYAPGTIGYLYEDCQQAVKEDSVAKFYTHWCGIFAEGYQMGAFIAAMRNHGSYEDGPSASENCKAAVTREHEWLKDRGFCKYRLSPDTSLYLVEAFLSWATWLKQNHPALLEKSVIPHINQYLRHGIFCDQIKVHGLPPSGIEVNPHLAKITGKAWDTQKQLPDFSDDEALRECYKDPEYQRMSADKFILSTCGAFHAGTLAGAYITDTPALNLDSDHDCQKEIDVMRRYEISARDACMPANVEPTDLKQLLTTQDWNFCGNTRNED